MISPERDLDPPEYPEHSEDCGVWEDEDNCNCGVDNEYDRPVNSEFYD